MSPSARLGLVPLLVVLIVGCTSFHDRRGDGGQPGVTASTGSPVPSSALEGQWSGEGALTDCAGFDEGCPETRSMTLAIDCAREPCAVSPFAGDYGSPPLRFEDGSYRAAGPVPPAEAPRCGGVPTASALWRLQLEVRDGRLAGSYTESTVQSFDCGATFVAWQVVLERA